MKPKNVCCIKKAELSHIPAIKAIIQQNLLTTKEDYEPQAVIEQSGFLLRDHPEEDLTKWIKDVKNNLILVMMSEHNVMGYIMACDISLESVLLTIPEVQKKMQHHKLLYHKQIGIKTSNQGYGGQLLLALCEAAKKRGYEYIICKISHLPYQNKGSIALHEKYGFKLLTTLTDKYCTAGIYVKNLV